MRPRAGAGRSRSGSRKSREAQIHGRRGKARIKLSDDPAGADQAAARSSADAQDSADSARASGARCSRRTLGLDRELYCRSRSLVCSPRTWRGLGGCGMTSRVSARTPDVSCASVRTGARRATLARRLGSARPLRRSAEAGRPAHPQPLRALAGQDSRRREQPAVLTRDGRVFALDASHFDDTPVSHTDSLGRDSHERIR